MVGFSPIHMTGNHVVMWSADPFCPLGCEDPVKGMLWLGGEGLKNAAVSKLEEDRTWRGHRTGLGEASSVQQCVLAHY